VSECEDCLEVKKLKLDVLALENNVSCRDVEHDVIIQGVATRMDNLETKFDDLRKDVKSDIQSIKDDIPGLFKNAINDLLATVAKWLIGGLIVILVIIAFAFSRPVLVQALQELTNKVNTYEVGK
jgi:hypothetical protein